MAPLRASSPQIRRHNGDTVTQEGLGWVWGSLHRGPTPGPLASPPVPSGSQLALGLALSRHLAHELASGWMRPRASPSGAGDLGLTLALSGPASPWVPLGGGHGQRWGGCGQVPASQQLVAELTATCDGTLPWTQTTWRKGGSGQAWRAGQEGTAAPQPRTPLWEAVRWVGWQILGSYYNDKPPLFVSPEQWWWQASGGGQLGDRWLGSLGVAPGGCPSSPRLLEET